MILEGHVIKQGKQWLAEIPVLDAMTQGESKKELLEMVQDLIRSLSGKEELQVSVACIRNVLQVEVKPVSCLLPLVLRRQRMKRGLTIRDVAKNLGYKNHNSYSAYEMGTSIPSFEKFEELLGGIISEKEQDGVQLKLAVA